MPLGFFSNTSSGVKPQHLANQTSDASCVSVSDAKDSRGTTVKLPKHTVNIERKLAEGGFAIVYLVSDKSNRQFALKRQFISDDLRQLEACKRECRIVSCLAGHKNIVEYVDHLITRSRSGVYEYSLLTAYYKNSVLQLINERIVAGRCLSTNEILAIFCDMCEAVARLHHSQTPVIHRDLKIENVLIDERRRGAPPIYVLCDFGSATTKVLSTDTHTLQYIEEEIQRYTTLSYRAPEMVDLYSGRPIGTKIDIWALGVMLYKMCYFMLPFGESALAIQNCAYSFPSEPQYPDELRAIIKALLESDIDKRPDIYQTAALAFEARSMRSPVGDLNKTKPIPLSKALASLRGEPLAEVNASNIMVAKEIPLAKIDSASLIKTDQTQSSTLIQGVGVTSVNPRLRPKPSTSAARFPTVGNAPNFIPSSAQQLTAQNAQSIALHQQNSVSNPDIGCSSLSTMDAMSKSDQSGTLMAIAHHREHSDLGFTDLEAVPRSEEASRVDKRFDDPDITYDSRMVRPPSRDHLSVHASAPQLFEGAHECSRVGDSQTNAFGGTLRSSAFKPYSVTSARGSVSARGGLGDNQVDAGTASDKAIFDLETNAANWNPFADAPYEKSKSDLESKRTAMDDRIFGKCFDELPRSNRRGSLSSTVNVKSRESLIMTIDESDPFGAAPFTPLSLRANGMDQEVSKSQSIETKHLDDWKCGHGDGMDSTSSTSDFRFSADVDCGADEESDCDEVRMESRRRFSYEHFDGVGDNASSESRDAPDDFTSEDDDNTKERDWSVSRSHEGIDWMLNEDATDRPLLDDDELDANCKGSHDVAISNSSSGLPLLQHSSEHNSTPSTDVTPPPPIVVREAKMPQWIGADDFQVIPHQESMLPHKTPAVPETNPFATKSFVTFSQPVIAVSQESTLPSRGISEFGTVQDSTGICNTVSSSAPHSERATHFVASAPLENSVDLSIRQQERVNVLVGEQTDSANANQRPPQSAPATISHDTVRSRHSRGTTSSGSTFEAITAFISPREKPRAKFVSSKRVSLSDSASSDESPQTDDSGAEMFSCSTSGAHGKPLVPGHQRKKSSGASHSLQYRGSSSSVVEQSSSASVKLSPLLKKCSGKRYGSTSSKRGSQGTLDASSFVNSTFQAEDWETKAVSVQPPSRHSLTQTS
uniref:non-specific serine/threonine protein kinase n=1 Tax=Parascaris univalens TaxID=6257 RepID=A0A915A593_PARUN